MTNEPTPETVQTGQNPDVKPPETESPTETRRPFIEAAKDAAGQWHWVLWSGNGRAMAINATPYQKRHDCTKAITLVKAAMKPDTKVVIAHE